MRFLPSSAAAACLIGLIAATSMVHAVETSDKPLRIVVPFAAGGLADVLARTLAEEMRTGFPKGIHVENKTGAGGNLGAAEVFNRPRSSESTIMISSPGPIAINQGLYAKLPYDPSQWLAIGTIASVPNALIVSPNLPIKTAQEFAPYAKQSAGRVSYASQGNGTTSHLTASLFSSLTGAMPLRSPIYRVARLMPSSEVWERQSHCTNRARYAFLRWQMPNGLPLSRTCRPLRRLVYRVCSRLPGTRR